MALYDKESLENLKQKIDLVDVLSSHLDLKRTGAAYKTLCPFHDEKTPSFMIQKGDTHYHCFGCGAHGDAITFLMTYLKMSFIESVENLAQRFQVHLKRVDAVDEPKGPNKAILKEALKTACDFYHSYLLHTPEGHEALHYLYSRGLDLDFIRHFQIGLAPKAPGLFRKAMYAKSFSNELLADAGLMVPREGGYRDFFYDRITFPIHSGAGDVIGFSARKYKEETFGGKYVNTPETALFKKSRVLFGLNYSRKRIAKERRAIIVEGQIDALRLIQSGFNLTVAGQGTAFGEDHARELINLGVNQVYLSLDGDDAGREATRKIGNIFQREGIEARVLSMPTGKDPDAFLREFGPESFLKLIEQSSDYLTFLVDHLSRTLNIDSPAGKNELIQTVTRQVREWKHPVMIHDSLKKLAHLTHIPEEMIGVGQEYIPNVYLKKSASIGGVEAIDSHRILEGDLLRWLVLLGETNPQFVSVARENLALDDIKSPTCRELFEVLLHSFENKKPLDLLSLATQIEDTAGQCLISELMHKKVNRDRAEQQLIETIQRILDRNWMEKREEIRMKIHNGQCSDEEVLELAKEFDKLKRCPPKVHLPQMEKV